MNTMALPGRTLTSTRKGREGGEDDEREQENMKNEGASYIERNKSKERVHMLSFEPRRRPINTMALGRTHASARKGREGGERDEHEQEKHEERGGV